MSQSTVTSGPNIVWVLTTQWRAQACGYAGDGNARTPVLDGLAREGINFRQAVTPHPFGPFARAALLTGRLSPQNGVRAYFDPLPSGARTIAHELNERGYQTAFFGKWHLGQRDPTQPLVGDAHARTLIPAAERGGFSYWEGFESGFLLNDPWLHGTRFPKPTRFAGYQSDVICAQAIEWATTQASTIRPWFVVVSVEAPHPPYEAPAAGVPPRIPDRLHLAANVPRDVGVQEKARRELAGYYAHVEATDRAIGRLVERLRIGSAVTSVARRSGHGRPTVIVVTSVHGDMHGAHGLFRKGWPFEESVRVPWLVSVLPGAKATVSGIHPGPDDSPVSLVDLPAMTLAWSAGETWRCPRELAEISMPSVVDLPYQCERAWRGTRTAQRKRIVNADGTPWLEFDLSVDPLEQRNLAAGAGASRSRGS